MRDESQTKIEQCPLAEGGLLGIEAIQHQLPALVPYSELHRSEHRAPALVDPLRATVQALDQRSSGRRGDEGWIERIPHLRIRRIWSTVSLRGQHF